MSKLRQSLGTSFTLHKASTVYRLEKKQNFFQIQFLEILYVLEETSQDQKKPKPSFFLASHAPWNWATAPGVIPRGPKYAQKPWEGSELPPACEMGHSF